MIIYSNKIRLWCELFIQFFAKVYQYFGDVVPATIKEKNNSFFADKCYVSADVVLAFYILINDMEQCRPFVT